MADGERVAMKDVVCRRPAELEQAMLEVSLLKSLHKAGACTPECFAHDVHRRADGTSVVRFAMARIPGEPLEDFLSKPREAMQAPAALQQGLGLVFQLVTQLGESLDAINQHVWHRDVNPRNVLISDAQSGESFDVMKGNIENVRFGLIDFGLAVDSGSWHSKWASSNIAGDCRYWPASSWVMSFQGSQALRQQPQLLRQYETKLDSYALGVLSLELLCSSLGQCNTSELSISCQGLLRVFTAFHSDMFRWNKEVNSVFSSGGNPQCLRQKFQQEGVPAKVQHHAVVVASRLRDVARDCPEPRARNLLCVIAELLDESSTLTLQCALEAAKDDELSPLVDDRQRPQEVTRRINAMHVSHRRVPLTTIVLPHQPMVTLANSPVVYRMISAR
jgi:serine/threonine protein kinase